MGQQSVSIAQLQLQFKSIIYLRFAPINETSLTLLLSLFSPLLLDFTDHAHQARERWLPQHNPALTIWNGASSCRSRRQ